MHGGIQPVHDLSLEERPCRCMFVPAIGNHSPDRARTGQVASPARSLLNKKGHRSALSFRLDQSSAFAAALRRFGNFSLMRADLPERSRR